MTGKEVVWEVIDWGMMLDRLDRDPPPLFQSGWQADYPDPDNLLRLGVPTHRVGWQNEIYSDLVEQARFITKHQERMNMRP